MAQQDFQDLAFPTQVGELITRTIFIARAYLGLKIRISGTYQKNTQHQSKPLFISYVVQYICPVDLSPFQLLQPFIKCPFIYNYLFQYILALGHHNVAQLCFCSRRFVIRAKWCPRFIWLPQCFTLFFQPKWPNGQAKMPIQTNSGKSLIIGQKRKIIIVIFAYQELSHMHK